MHNLFPNPKNYLCMYFGHILEYLQTSCLPNTPNCDTTQQTPYFRFISIYLWIQRYNCFLHQTMSHSKSISTSSFSYSIGLCCTTTHNTAPHVYTSQGYTVTNNVTILFHHKITNLKTMLNILDQIRTKRTHYLHSPLSPTINGLRLRIFQQP